MLDILEKSFSEIPVSLQVHFYRSHEDEADGNLCLICSFLMIVVNVAKLHYISFMRL